MPPLPKKRMFDLVKGEGMQHSVVVEPERFEQAPDDRLWVVVPAYNEERSIGHTLRRLSEQTDPEFVPLVVDNGSTDHTAQIVRSFARAHPALGLRLIDEPQKGTGAAADTGFRRAIAAGATHVARTDADCLPAHGWVAAVKRAFADGLSMVSGPLRPRTDEFPLRLWERRLLPAILELGALAGKYRPANRDPGYLGPYLMMPGCNVAITAELYERCGGFPRTRIEELHEDRALFNQARRLTAAYGLRREVLVHGSVRRLRAYGLLGTIGWYFDHHHRPETVDIR